MINLDFQLIEHQPDAGCKFFGFSYRDIMLKRHLLGGFKKNRFAF
jgi:hypothetical protein